jgi:hypothetical protein
MTLIEESVYNETKVKYYEGIDFDILQRHPKDGSSGFIYCFINSWVKEVQSYNRNNKLKSIIKDFNYKDFNWETINNDYICIYQTDGISIELLFRTIKEKLQRENYLPKSAYLNITELNSEKNNIINSGGAWKIKSDEINN